MSSWTRVDVERVCSDKGWAFTQREIQDGIQFTLADGVRINLYDSGRVVIGGKSTPNRTEVEAIFSSTTPSDSPRSGRNSINGQVAPPRRVFIVYGHDVNAREQLELILRRLRLEPIVLQNVPSSGDTIIEKLETLSEADFACVLLTPDDEGYPCGLFERKKYRARQNVVLELGMVLARLGRKRVAVLVKGDDLERPSDIDGLIYLSFTNRVEEIINKIAANLQTAGFDIKVSDLIT